MAIDYKQLAAQVRARQNPDNVSLSQPFATELAGVAYSDVLTYLKLAMNAVEPAYTAKSREAGERVKDHLIAGGLKDVAFEYQGSVMTDTHIKGHSDIDLLAISEKFYHIDAVEVNAILSDATRKSQYYPSQVNSLTAEYNHPRYPGDTTADLQLLRSDSERILLQVYDVCEIKKPKSVKIYNGNLRREVDIVIASWYDDTRSIISGKGYHRGIKIYNKETQTTGAADYPFLSISRINERSALTVGRLKKMIRFLKNIKAKSPLNIELNSFEFNAICYDINVAKYKDLPYYGLVYVLLQQLVALATSTALADQLRSVDGSEWVFRDKPDRLQSLRHLVTELQAVYNDLKYVI